MAKTISGHWPQPIRRKRHMTLSVQNLKLHLEDQRLDKLKLAETMTATPEKNNAAALAGAQQKVEEDALRSEALQNEVVDLSNEASEKYVEDVTEAYSRWRRRRGLQGQRELIDEPKTPRAQSNAADSSRGSRESKESCPAGGRRQ